MIRPDFERKKRVAGSFVSHYGTGVMNRKSPKRVSIPEDEQRWQATRRRDPNADGAFVFAVRSTGVYCRPSCPARRPHRHQVRFFPSCAAAELEGFRPCRRCRPRERSPHAALVLGVCRWIQEHLEERNDLSSLARRVGLSPFHLQRIFKRSLGITPRQYLDGCRFEAFKNKLRQASSVTEAVYAAGYGSSSRAYERTGARLGMTPSHYRGGGKEIGIRYATVACPLGRLLIAATERGICAISLGDRDALLEASLRKEFPAAKIRRDRHGLGLAVQAALRYLNGSHSRLDLPLDVRATAFQWRVWSALRSIPRGQTRSYSQIANAIGQPRAIRAVAHACAANPAALLIPCHRAIRSDGQLGGYRWGLKRKQQLLHRENTSVRGSSP